MIDDAFFVRWQRVIVWLANTWIGRVYLTSNWNRTQRRIDWRWIDAPHFTQITPSAFTFALGDGRFVTRCYTANHFAQKVAGVLFWLPYQRASGVRRGFAYALGAFIAMLCGFPAAVGSVAYSPFNTVAGSNVPLDGVIASGGDPTFPPVRNATSGFAAPTTNATEKVSTANAVGAFQIRRMFLDFVTGSIPRDAAIAISVNSNLTMRTGADFHNPDATAVTVVQTFHWNADNDLNLGDFCQITPSPVSAGVPHTEGVQAAGRFQLSTYANDTSVVFPLRAGLGWIARDGETKPVQALTPGITHLGLVMLTDVNTTTPTGDAFGDDAEFVMADNGSNKPQLSVEWRRAAWANPGPRPSAFAPGMAR